MRLMGFMMLGSFEHDVTVSGCVGDGSAGNVGCTSVWGLAVCGAEYRLSEII